MYIVNKLHNFPYLIHSFTFRDFPPSSASVNPIRLQKIEFASVQNQLPTNLYFSQKNRQYLRSLLRHATFWIQKTIWYFFLKQFFCIQIKNIEK